MDWVTDGLRKASMLLDRQRRLDAAVRRVASDYEVPIWLLHRARILLEKHLKRQTMYSFEVRALEGLVYRIRREYHNAQ